MQRQLFTLVPANRTLRALALGATSTLVACGGSGGSDVQPTVPPEGGEPANPAPVIQGDITRYGVVNVADEAGQASDAIAAFNTVDPGVGALAFGTAADLSGAPCEVVPSSSGGNDLLLVGYSPAPRGAQSTSIMAGDTITLTDAGPDGGTWTTLMPESASAVAFYDGPVPDGPVPAGLQVDVSGAADAEGFPGFSMATLPSVTPLGDFTVSDGGAIDAQTTFGWTASSDAASRVRIVATTGFFGDQENGKRVSCLVADTGSFSFPSDTRAELGDDFQGELFVSSRLSIGTVQVDETLLFLVRESFTAD